MRARRHIGILGGTFDPVHLGHLRTAVDLQERLRLDQLLLIPVGVPPHRPRPRASTGHRLAMLRLALRGEAKLQVDERECRKTQTAYTVETLRQLRAEVGDEATLSFCVGADAFLGMQRWYCWRELPSLAHIVVMSRPGRPIPDDLGALDCWRDRFVGPGVGAGGRGDNGFEQLRRQQAGRIVFVTLTPMAISATHIRMRIAEGRSARFLVPDSVWRYIQRNGLYLDTTPAPCPSG